MKMINETIIRRSIKKVLKEEFSFFQLKNAKNHVDKIIENFDSINCDGYSDEEYVNVYCSDYGDASLEEMIEIKEYIDSEMKLRMHREFKNKSSWTR